MQPNKNEAAPLRSWLPLKPRIEPPCQSARTAAIVLASNATYFVHSINHSGGRGIVPSLCYRRGGDGDDLDSAGRAALRASRSRCRKPVKTPSASDAERSTKSTSALPTIPPSATHPIACACSGVEMPKPTHTGSAERALTRPTTASTSDGTCVLAPVTPVRETQ